VGGFFFIFEAADRCVFLQVGITRHMSQSQEKIDAIYDLREAVAAKVRLEAEVDRASTPDTRGALLDATLEMEAKTQQAIEVCHECGHVHHDRFHPRGGDDDNVIEVDFQQSR
jgi:hypothetical protein